MGRWQIPDIDHCQNDLTPETPCYPDLIRLAILKAPDHTLGVVELQENPIAEPHPKPGVPEEAED